MQSQYATASSSSQEASTTLYEHLDHFLEPLLRQLAVQLDVRLVRTFLGCLQVLIQFRDSTRNLLLSELGAFLCSPAHAPAGTKRLSRLLHSPKWTASLLTHFLWQQAEHQLIMLEQAHEDALAVWDETVLEKPESVKSEGLCPVRSSTAHRLQRIKPGFFTPPTSKPTFVPGFRWLGLLLTGRSGGPPTLAAMQWWTSRGENASTRRKEETALVQRAAQAWGRRVLHLFDRGFAGEPWLAELLGHQLRFVLRWPKEYLLQEQATGRHKKPAQLSIGRKSWGQRALWDSHQHRWHQVGVLAVPVRHPHVAAPLWLVISRPGTGHRPWYLLTSEAVKTEEEAWRIVLAYCRRWQIEECWRYEKSELGAESVRLWWWDEREKLLLMVSLVYAFLLSLMEEVLTPLRSWLLDHWCPRTGKRCRLTTTPLYRLRLALSYLWQAYPLQNSG